MNDPLDDGVAAVRKRPGMYVGSIDDGSALHNMVCEVVGNAINEALAGHAKNISVSLNRDGSCTVRDDGRGLPTHLHPRSGTPVAELAMTKLIGGADEYRPDGFHGVGLCPVNALSEWLELRIYQSDHEHRMRFRLGLLEKPLTVAGKSMGQHGTELTFLPDASIFGGATFDRATLARRLQELPTQYSVLINFEDVRGSQ